MCRVGVRGVRRAEDSFVSFVFPANRGSSVSPTGPTPCKRSSVERSLAGGEPAPGWWVKLKCADGCGPWAAEPGVGRVGPGPSRALRCDDVDVGSSLDPRYQQTPVRASCGLRSRAFACLSVHGHRSASVCVHVHARSCVSGCVCMCARVFLGVSVGALGFPVRPSFAIGWHRTREVALTRKRLTTVRGLGASASRLRPVAPGF